VLGAAGGYLARVRRLKTRQRELERRVAERTAELATANEDLQAFSYSVSHDLRAPLRHIEGFSGAVLDQHAAGLDPEGRGLLIRVRDVSQRTQGLIDDMLVLSQVALGEMHLEPTDLAVLAREIVAELQKAHPRRQVTFVAPPALPVTADASLIRIALENLLNNAWKFTSKRAAARIELGAQPHHGGTAYFVRDDGAGFDPRFSRKLFIAFQRLHAPSDFEGTGVGLTIVRRVIQRHGGQVWAEGQPDAGATFYFTLGPAPGERKHGP
jgi:light-regulated signal transduction histidine kinase (bacteriophytochrome)